MKYFYEVLQFMPGAVTRLPKARAGKTHTANDMSFSASSRHAVWTYAWHRDHAEGHGIMKQESSNHLFPKTASSFGASSAHDAPKNFSDIEACRRHLLNFSREIVVPRGTKLRVDRVYYLLEGAVTLTAMSAVGGAHSLIYFHPGDLLSFIPSVNQAYSIPHEAFDFLLYNESLVMCTKTHCRLLSMEQGEFMRHMDEEPLKSLLILGLAGNLMKIIVQSVNNTTLSATVRVCRMLSVFMEKKPPHALPRYLTYTEIAGHLSMHVMTVTKIFQSLRKEGILGKDKGITFVKKTDELMKLASQLSQISYRNAAHNMPDHGHLSLK